MHRRPWEPDYTVAPSPTGPVTTVLIPCEKCHREVPHRFRLRTTVLADGSAEVDVVQTRDPHICPRPTSGKPTWKGARPIATIFDELARTA